MSRTCRAGARDGPDGRERAPADVQLPRELAELDGRDAGRVGADRAVPMTAGPARPLLAVGGLASSA